METPIYTGFHCALVNLCTLNLIGRRLTACEDVFPIGQVVLWCGCARIRNIRSDRWVLYSAQISNSSICSVTHDDAAYFIISCGNYTYCKIRKTLLL